MALEQRDYSEAQKAGYAPNRTFLAKGLRELGFELPEEGDGAFYAYAGIKRFSNDSMSFCLRLLDEAGVAATPGVDFDRTEGNCYVRFSYAGTRQSVEEALGRMSAFLAAGQTVMSTIPLLRTQRLTLRAPVMADYPAYARFMASDRSRMMGGPAPTLGRRGHVRQRRGDVGALRARRP